MRIILATLIAIELATAATLALTGHLGPGGVWALGAAQAGGWLLAEISSRTWKQVAEDRRRTIESIARSAR